MVYRIVIKKTLWTFQEEFPRTIAIYNGCRGTQPPLTYRFDNFLYYFYKCLINYPYQ
jgi:hypothetical protein